MFIIERSCSSILERSCLSRERSCSQAYNVVVCQYRYNADVQKTCYAIHVRCDGVQVRHSCEGEKGTNTDAATAEEDRERIKAARSADVC